jgi:hypothetical protein
LDRINPDWRLEARSHPEQAKLCDADLGGAHLGGANLIAADLRGAHLIVADLSDADLTGTDLRGAHLGGADLRGAHLIGVDLRGADLTDTDLSGVDLRGAHLRGAHLIGADLSGADLRSVDLSGVDLRGAHLGGAHLGGADLTDTDLRTADLSGADLTGTLVSKAKLAYVDLTGAIYAPESEPPDPYVVEIRGLWTLHVPSGKGIGLVQLRKLLQEAGLRNAERAATYAIERSGTTELFASAPMLIQNPLRHFGFIDGVQLPAGRHIPPGSDNSAGSFGWIAGLFRVLGFDVTTAYGLHPMRALVWIAVLSGIFTFVYMFAIPRTTLKGEAPVAVSNTQTEEAEAAVRKVRTRDSGIYKVFPADRIEETSAEPTVERESRWKRVEARNLWSAFLWAAYFSLLSAVNIGFEQFTPGDWIRRLPTREYSLEAVGWVRSVAGAQALLSVYLLAMWVLTQFGRPFE